jgi:hypothetical protein
MLEGVLGIVGGALCTFKKGWDGMRWHWIKIGQECIRICCWFAIQVQSGGSFDVDYSVVGPTDKVILDGTKERQGDFVFTANDVGEYRFCFNNEMSTFAEKMVDFEIAVCISYPPSILSHAYTYRVHVW